MSFRGAIFDMDGTLVDSMWIWKDLAQRFLEKKNIASPPGLSNRFKNMTFESSSVYLAQNFPLHMTPEEIRREWTDMVYRCYEKELFLKQGALEYLQRLRRENVKLALLTSNFRESCEACLRLNRITDLFDSILTSDELGQSKQQPEIYRKAAERLAVPPESCMVFEDILVAVQSAKKAGMMVTAVEDAASLPERDEIKKTADRYIVSFEELL